MSYILSRFSRTKSRFPNLSFTSTNIDSIFSSASKDAKSINFYAVKDEINLSDIRSIYKNAAKLKIDTNIRFFNEHEQLENVIDKIGVELTSGQDEKNDHETGLKQNQFIHTCLGGTFDDIHLGHKLLITEAIYITSKKMTIGLANDELLKKKNLKIFLQNFKDRKSGLEKFLSSVDYCDQITFDVQEINDAVGPAGTISDLTAITVSEETRGGVEVINNIRQEKGLNSLAGHVCPVLLDNTSKMSEKISSSTIRKEKFGQLLKPVNKSKHENNDHKQPYIIGLTGGSCSGKSSIAKKLDKISSTKSLKAVIIDCDKLGHLAYNVDTDCYKKLVEHFGQEIVLSSENSNDRSINRAALGSIVFKDKSQLKNLTDIVWPEIQKMVQQKISKMDPAKEVAIIDAAILIEANWASFCNEVWVCSLDRKEQIKRIVERDNKTVEQAEGRLNSQMSEEERNEFAHVVLSSKWEHEYTYEQCVKAWDLLEKRLMK